MDQALKKTNTLKAWFLAIRPKTLPVSLPPILVGTALAHAQGKMSWLIAFSALFVSLFIQIGTNLFNDALDFKKGADREGRLGPTRMTQAGLLSFKEMMVAGSLFFALSYCSGIPLMIAGGWPLSLILFVSVICGYCYTGGPYPLSYLGISDLFILIFFGWVSTCSVYYLQTGTLSLSSILAGTQIGLLAIVPHAINNARDRLSDAVVNKKTLAVRFGHRFALLEITFLSFFPFILGFYWIILGYPRMALLPFIILPPIGRNVITLWRTPPSPEYNECLAKSAKYQLLFGCLLTIGLIL